MAELLVVSGPPGAGKSTVAARLADRFEPSALVTGDSFFAFLARGRTDPWLPEAHRQNEVVVSAAAAATERFVSGGLSVVYDGVVGPWFLDLLARRVPQLHYLVLLPPLATCLERVAARTDHGFDDPDATRRMHRDFADAAIPPRHVLSAPSEPPERVADQVFARVLAGSLRLEP